MPPATLEDRLRMHFLVSQCMLVGEGRPFVGTLVPIEPDAVALWAEQRGKSTAVGEPDGVPGRGIRILPVDWTEEAGQLTPSLKVRRGAVMRQFQHEIERLYERS